MKNPTTEKTATPQTACGGQLPLHRGAKENTEYLPPDLPAVLNVLHREIRENMYKAALLEMLLDDLSEEDAQSFADGEKLDAAIASGVAMCIRCNARAEEAKAICDELSGGDIESCCIEERAVEAALAWKAGIETKEREKRRWELLAAAGLTMKNDGEIVLAEEED